MIYIDNAIIRWANKKKIADCDISCIVLWWIAMAVFYSYQCLRCSHWFLLTMGYASYVAYTYDCGNQK